MILFRHLSLQLLLLLFCSIFLVQLLLAVPLIAEYRLNWLNRRLSDIHSFLSMVPLSESEQHFSKLVDIYSIKDKDNNVLLQKEAIPTIDASFDLLESSFFQSIHDTVFTLVSFDNRTIEVTDFHAFIVIMDEKPLWDDLIAFVQWISILNAIFLVLVSTISYFIIQRIFLSPLQNIQHSLVSFQPDSSEDADNIIHIIQETPRQDELGVIQNQLAYMQSTVYTALRQKQRLSTLGTAVAKIHHDLSNILQTAVLLSGRLTDISDPEVKRISPKLVRALDRAAELCEQNPLLCS